MTPQEQISVTLSAAEWNTVMQKLGTHPYAEVVQLIHTIQTQCIQHEMSGIAKTQNRQDQPGVPGQNE